MDRTYTKKLSIVLLNIFSQSSLFMDSVSATSLTHRNLFATPKSILTLLSESFTDMHRIAEKLSWPRCLFTAERGGPWPSCFSSPTINKCSFCGLCSATCFAFCAFCWWFHCLKWSPDIVLKCCLAFLRRLWCALWREFTCEISFAHMLSWAMVLLVVNSVSVNQQHMLNGNTKQAYVLIYWLVDENAVSRSLQEPNLVFLLGAMVMFLLIQCLWQWL